MKYRLYTEKQYRTPTEQVLYGRGIENIQEWINASDENIENWSALKNITEAVNCVREVVENGFDTAIIVDCDVDGFTSAAIFNNYLYSLYPDWINRHAYYLLHSGKEHGLSDMVERIPEGVKLIICPDSATNDYEYHKMFDGIAKIVILDHHEADHESTARNTITVNNQLCDYKNKMLSGAGIVWQFCRAYNELCGVEGEIDDDLCALGNLSDMMSYKSLETKAIISKGLSNITNPFFYQMTKDNEYTLNKYGGLNYKAVAFGVTPFINATIRSGTAEEKDIVFKAMCKPTCYNKVKNTKRGHRDEEWPLYKEAAYLTSAIKRRQTKLETEGLDFLEKQVKENELYKEPIIVCRCNPGDVEPNIRGLIANKLASKYQRPCLVLTKTRDKDKREYFYSGSGRNYGMSEIKDLRQIIEDSQLIEYAQGHASAFGVSVSEDNIDNFKKYMNTALKDTDFTPVYWVDYVWNMETVSSNSLLSLAEMSCYWGQDIPASQVIIKDIDLNQCKVTLCGAKNNTIRIVFPSGLVLVKFGVDEDTFERLCQENIYMTCLVSPSKNEWMGMVSGEGIIEDFEIESKWVF